jgi:SOS-response transcriptional repressor LexA
MRTLPPLSPQQAELLDFIKAFWRDHRRSPCLKEMAHATGCKSHGPVLRKLNALALRGLIVRVPSQVQIVEQDQAA